MKCNIAGCSDRAQSNGLCAKHYMRQRRHGGDVVLKSGPKPKETKAQERKAKWAEQWSDATFERYWSAYRVLDDSGASEEERRQVYRRAERPSGRLNVTLFVRLAWALYTEKHPDAGLDDEAELDALIAADPDLAEFRETSRQQHEHAAKVEAEGAERERKRQERSDRARAAAAKRKAAKAAG